MHARYFSWGVFACVARLDYVILISPSFTSKSRMCCIATHPGFCKTVTSNICRLYSSHMTCFVSLPTREWEGDDIGQNLARLSLRAHQHRRPASRRDPSRIGNRTDGQDVSSWVHTCTSGNDMLYFWPGYVVHKHTKSSTRRTKALQPRCGSSIERERRASMVSSRGT